MTPRPPATRVACDRNSWREGTGPGGNLSLPWEPCPDPTKLKAPTNSARQVDLGRNPRNWAALSPLAAWQHAFCSEICASSVPGPAGQPTVLAKQPDGGDRVHIDMSLDI